MVIIASLRLSVTAFRMHALFAARKWTFVIRERGSSSMKTHKKVSYDILLSCSAVSHIVLYSACNVADHMRALNMEVIAHMRVLVGDETNTIPCK